jgi:serine phosphatase RsbU (regulator of sigma subunit)/Tfp pilus assembly protein PilF
MPFFGVAQNFSTEEQHQIDSLNKVIANPNSHDTSLAGAYVDLSVMLYVVNLDTVKILCKKTQEIAEKGLSTLISESIRKKLNSSLANALNNIGWVYHNQGDIPRALEYYHISLKTREKNGDVLGEIESLRLIGLLYQEQGDTIKALSNFYKSLELSEKIGEKKEIAVNLNNIGTVYYSQNKLIISLEYYQKSLRLNEEIGAKLAIANNMNNIGTIFLKKGDIPKAIEYFNGCLAILNKLNDKTGSSHVLLNLGRIYSEQGDISQALSCGEKGLAIAEEIGLPELIHLNANLLSQVYEKQGKHNKALEMYKLHIQMRDSINNEATQKATVQQQAKYKYEKQKAVDDAEHDKQIAIEQEAKEKQTILTYATGGGVGLVGIFLIFVFNRLRVTRKQKNIIETQKQEVEKQKEVVELAHHELEEKNQEIMDSITYAKRIQSAILPPAKVVKEYLQESFILYKPKDIVAGDFYWMEIIGDESRVMSNENPTLKTQHSKHILFAAADCTGHGVPGAMVSVVCNNGLNRSVREYGLTDPGDILNKTREIVVQEFEKSEEEVKDGMDIAICSLDGTTLKYAGAHNPLWIIRNGELLETKANKQPIGKFDNPEPYTTHTIELQKGDSLYIFSDGYADQFGGEKGKKLKSANFKKLLLSIQKENMTTQKQLIDEAFENWKGNLEQLDDVCIIGVKI